MNWLMRKLPKRVLKVGDMYRPQVWLLWWHGIYDGEAVSPLEYDKLEDAVWMLALGGGAELQGQYPLSKRCDADMWWGVVLEIPQHIWGIEKHRLFKPRLKPCRVK